MTLVHTLLLKYLKNYLHGLSGAWHKWQPGKTFFVFCFALQNSRNRSLLFNSVLDKIHFKFSFWSIFKNLVP